MKTDITKLYKQLTPKELGNLAVDAIISKDFKGAELIKNSVERKTYECNDMEYQSRLNGIVQLGLFYGVEWWKNQALLTAGLWLTNQTEPDTNIQNHDDDAIAAIKELQARLASLELAINQICEQSQIDINAVKYWAGIEERMNMVFMPILSHCHNEKWLNYYLELFSNTAKLETHAPKYRQ